MHISVFSVNKADPSPIHKGHDARGSGNPTVPWALYAVFTRLPCLIRVALVDFKKRGERCAASIGYSAPRCRHSFSHSDTVIISPRHSLPRHLQSLEQPWRGFCEKVAFRYHPIKSTISDSTIKARFQGRGEVK